MGGLRQLLLAVGIAASVGAVEAPLPAVSVRLLVESTTVAPGQSFRAGVLFTLADDWHLYWRNPGEAGLPPRIQWRVPPGWAVRDSPWPAPQRFADGTLVSYGYATEVLLSAVISVPAAAAAESLEIGADVSWLGCQEACVPGRASLSQRLSIVPAPTVPAPAAAALFDRFEARWPRPSDQWQVAAWRQADGIVVSFRPTAATAWPVAAGMEFFPAEPGLVASLPERTAGGPAAEARVRLQTLTEEHRALGQVVGVLVLPPPPAPGGSGTTVLVDATLADGPDRPATPPPRAKENAR